MNRETFETLLETARALRRRRRERPTRLVTGAGRRSRPAAIGAIDVRAIRALTGLSQFKFAELLDIGPATLRNWEQGRRSPTGPARALLRAIRHNPVEVIKALSN